MEPARFTRCAIAVAMIVAALSGSRAWTADGGSSAEGSGDVGDGLPATSAKLSFPFGVAVDGSGNVYIADAGNNRIRKVDSGTGIISTVAGTGATGYSGDGGPATAAKLNGPHGVAIDSAGNVYICDAGNNRIRKVDASGKIITVNAELDHPKGVAVNAKGELFVTDGNLLAGVACNGRIRKISKTGRISMIVDGGKEEWKRDEKGEPPAPGIFCAFSGIAIDESGNLIVCATSFEILKIGLSGKISRIGGGGTVYSGDGGPATEAKFSYPTGVAVDSAGNVYFTEWDNNNDKVRKINAYGQISTVAGTGEKGYSGDGGPATAAKLHTPYGVAVDRRGSIYIVDSGNDFIRKVDASGIITTFAGGGSAKPAGAATSAGVAEAGGRALQSYLRALTAYGTKNYRLAIQEAKAAVKADPGMWQAWQADGTARYELGDRDGALAAWREALRINPNNLGLKAFVSALTAYGTKDYLLAIQEAEAAVKEDPGMWQAWQMDGTARYALGDREGALAVWREALRINPNNPELRAFVESIASQSQPTAR